MLIRDWERVRHLGFIIQLIGLLCVGAAIAGAASGCAASYQTPARETIGKAAMAIEDAEKLDADQHARAELASAREKLDEAEERIDEDNGLMAWRYAEQAVADANLARAKSHLAKARHSLVHADEALEDVKDETLRR